MPLTAAYAAAAGGATYVWPDVFLLRAVPYRLFLIIGLLLLAPGLPMWLFAAVSVMRAYKYDRLVTSGVFGMCRHPLYAAAILFVLPGLALLSGSWPVMITPLVAYLVFKSLIRVEDDYLRERFGKPYLEYRARVNELFPIPRR